MTSTRDLVRGPYAAVLPKRPHHQRPSANGRLRGAAPPFPFFLPLAVANQRARIERSHLATSIHVWSPRLPRNPSAPLEPRFALFPCLFLRSLPKTPHWVSTPRTQRQAKK